MVRLRMIGVFGLALLCPLAAAAQKSADDPDQETANPIAEPMSIRFQLNIDFGLGEFDRTRNVLNIQPVIPLAERKLITRTIFPIVWLPDIIATSASFACRSSCCCRHRDPIEVKQAK